MSYVGAIAGIIGCGTGISGAVVGFLALRRAREIKALDLRLELRRIEGALRADIGELVPLLERAKRSHSRLAAARGSFNSGATAHWLTQWEIDLACANEFVAGASELDVDIKSFGHMELEDRLITVHKLQRRVSNLAGKYHASLSADDAGRDQLREDQRVITQARLDGKL